MINRDHRNCFCVVLFLPNSWSEQNKNNREKWAHNKHVWISIKFELQTNKDANDLIWSEIKQKPKSRWTQIQNDALNFIQIRDELFAQEQKSECWRRLKSGNDLSKLTVVNKQTQNKFKASAMPFVCPCVRERRDVRSHVRRRKY